MYLFVQKDDFSFAKNNPSIIIRFGFIENIIPFIFVRVLSSWRGIELVVFHVFMFTALLHIKISVIQGLFST